MTPTSSATSLRPELLGPAFADALARRDFAQMAEVLSPDIDFLAVTPRRPTGTGSFENGETSFLSGTSSEPAPNTSPGV